MANMIYGFTPTHPGEVLKDEIEERGIQQKVLAESMGISYKVLNDILNERRPVTTDTERHRGRTRPNSPYGQRGSHAARDVPLLVDWVLSGN